MRYSDKAIVAIGAVAVALAGALALAAASTPAQAGISVELAKSCRALMIKAHPTQAFGAEGSAAAQRTYFAQCVSRQGRMGQEPTTTGSGIAGSEPTLGTSGRAP